jgi:hypothetical protein
MSEPSPESPPRPGLVRRVAAGAWHVPAGFVILLRNPRLWPIAFIPVVLAVLLMFPGSRPGSAQPRGSTRYGSSSRRGSSSGQP